MTLEDYKIQFQKLGKEDIFELNKPFLIEMISLENKILKLRELVGDNFIIVHPKYKDRCRVPDSEHRLLKLENQYKDMTLTLNKIVGKVTTDEEDPMEKWLNEYKNKSGE